jgi:hypothetical protein
MSFFFLFNRSNFASILRDYIGIMMSLSVLDELLLLPLYSNCGLGDRESGKVTVSRQRDRKCGREILRHCSWTPGAAKFVTEAIED